MNRFGVESSNRQSSVTSTAFFGQTAQPATFADQPNASDPLRARGYEVDSANNVMKWVGFQYAETLLP